MAPQSVPARNCNFNYLFNLFKLEFIHHVCTPEHNFNGVYFGTYFCVCTQLSYVKIQKICKNPVCTSENISHAVNATVFDFNKVLIVLVEEFNGEDCNKRSEKQMHRLMAEI